eukprot:7761896-Prorocentrum_lima.AAC.1
MDVVNQPNARTTHPMTPHRCAAFHVDMSKAYFDQCVFDPRPRHDPQVRVRLPRKSGLKRVPFSAELARN